MPFSYKIEEGIVFTIATGEITMPQQEAFMRTWLAGPDLPTPLLICRDVVDEGVTHIPNWSRDLVGFAKSLDFPDGSRFAIVASRDLYYGMARQFQIWADDAQNFSVGVFRDRDEAIKWLRQESHS